MHSAAWKNTVDVSETNAFSDPRSLPASFLPFSLPCPFIFLLFFERSCYYSGQTDLTFLTFLSQPSDWVFVTMSFYIVAVPITKSDLLLCQGHL